MKQLTFIPEHKAITDKDMDRFILANAGSYFYKRWFYRFKNFFLEKHAIRNGYDLQIVERMCNSCGGDGIYRYYSEGKCYDKAICWHCNKGVYRTDRILLQRYVINGKLFHIPDFEGLLIPVNPINIIKGLIKHDIVDNHKAQRAFVYLMFKYEYALGVEWLSMIARDYKNSFKSKANRMGWRIMGFLKKDKFIEELPF